MNKRSSITAWLAMGFLWGLGTVVDAQISESLGTLPQGKSVTLVFEVAIDSPLPVTVTHLTTQGTVQGDGFSAVNTDDPETPAIEDATVTELARYFDFGDAPDPTYPTLLTQDGARHFVPGGGAAIYLGATAPDPEEDAQTNATAAGDDAAGDDDEDGVVIPAILPSQGTVELSVTAVGSGYLNAWIDFNRDGDWSDAGEQVFLQQSLIDGLNALSYTTPMSVESGKTFARFRFSSEPSLGITGLAPDGEVEDYEVILNSPPVATDDTIVRYPTQGVKVLVSTLLANDTDANADALTVDAVGDALPFGASVVRDGDWVFFTPPAGHTGSGSFSYTASDGRGGSDTGAVTVTIVVDNDPSRNWSGIEHQGGDNYQITFHGIPGRTYTIQYTDVLDPPNTVWTFLGQSTADGVGIYKHTDTSGSPARFYRSIYP
ncbi:MAG TPA: GEVED domain-containing protein [Candidatus Paceibacterota bacterium]|nr:GEVED domain-containing protein [Verrucomicrobiota bacterium]HRY49203.1 GEVED domain-containing protein [Candidatus Paceibacterota bacterium]